MHRMFVWLKAGDTPLRTAFQCSLVCLLENIVGSFFRLLICTQARRCAQSCAEAQDFTQQNRCCLSTTSCWRTMSRRE